MDGSCCCSTAAAAAAVKVTLDYESHSYSMIACKSWMVQRDNCRCTERRMCHHRIGNFGVGVCVDVWWICVAAAGGDHNKRNLLPILGSIDCEMMMMMMFDSLFGVSWCTDDLGSFWVVVVLVHLHCKRRAFCARAIFRNEEG